MGDGLLVLSSKVAWEGMGPWAHGGVEIRRIGTMESVNCAKVRSTGAVSLSNAGISLRNAVSWQPIF